VPAHRRKDHDQRTQDEDHHHALVDASGWTTCKRNNDPLNTASGVAP
jgi:hypothetical protein